MSMQEKNSKSLDICQNYKDDITKIIEDDRNDHNRHTMTEEMSEWLSNIEE
jgi:hypothetical protein